MPAFDRASQKIVVRIVYDGAAQAGKTTNLRQLAGHFTERRRSELFVPSEREGRTLFFDFMHLDGGLVAGQPLRCQFVTVPGQRKLAGRRKQILQSADAVVFVCSSAARAQDKNRVMLDTLRWSLRSVGKQDVPIIVQANKQDLRTALQPEAVREALGLGPEVALVGAAAHSGAGVRETSVLAIRAAARQVELLLLERGFDEVLGRAESGEELLSRLQPIAVDDLTDEDLVDEAAEPVAQVPGEPSDAGSEGPTEADTETDTDTGTDTDTDTDTGEQAPATERPAPSASSAPCAPVRSGDQAPPRPHDDVPTGCVWPSTTGRQVLRALSNERWRLRDDLSGRRGDQDGSGAPDARVYEVGGYCAKTSGRRRFDSADDAKAALLTLARRKILLGELLPPSTVIAAQQADTGAWLWTLAPWLPSLRARMSEAERAADEAALGSALEEFAAAAARAVTLALQQGLVLDVHPSNFASAGGELYYLDDDIDLGGTLPQLGHALLQRVEEYAAHAAVVARYLRAVVDAVSAAATPEQLEAVGLLDALEQACPRSPLAQAAQSALLQSLRGSRRSQGAC